MGYVLYTEERFQCKLSSSKYKQISSISLSELVSMGIDIDLMISKASFRALLYAEMMTTG